MPRRIPRKGRDARMHRRGAGLKYRGIRRLLVERGLDPRIIGKANPEEFAEAWKDLDNVGTTKAAGYLPRGAIRTFCRKTVEEAVQALRDKGLGVLALTESECTIRGGAVYAFDRSMVEQILTQHADIVAGKGWAGDVDSVMAEISTVWFETDDPAMPLIRDLYDDKAP